MIYDCLKKLIVCLKKMYCYDSRNKNRGGQKNNGLLMKKQKRSYKFVHLRKNSQVSKLKKIVCRSLGVFIWIELLLTYVKESLDEEVLVMQANGGNF